MALLLVVVSRGTPRQLGKPIPGACGSTVERVAEKSASVTSPAIGMTASGGGKPRQQIIFVRLRPDVPRLCGDHSAIL